MLADKPSRNAGVTLRGAVERGTASAMRLTLHAGDSHEARVTLAVRLPCTSQAARALMQQGLRVCQDSPLLWAEYFRFELLYAHKLRVRRKVLGLAGPEDAPLDASDETEVRALLGRSEAFAAAEPLSPFAPCDLQHECFRARLARRLRPGRCWRVRWRRWC